MLEMNKNSVGSISVEPRAHGTTAVKKEGRYSYTIPTVSRATTRR